MAVKISEKGSCPQCGDRLLVNEGAFVKWLICPSCKFRKLIEKSDDERKRIKISSLKEVK